MVLLVLVLPTAQPGPSSTSSEQSMLAAYDHSPAAPVRGPLITEVCPGRPVEYVIITNFGDELVLDGMTIDDGEGTIILPPGMVLGSGASVAFTADGKAFADLRPGIRCIEKGNASLGWSGRFALADGGDEVLLRAGDRSVIDAAVYGASAYRGDGWSGPPVVGVTKGHAMVRRGGDTNTSSDWKVEPPGRSDHPQPVFDAVVEPFSAPETAAWRIARELSLASRTANCSVYEISDPFIVEQLVRCVRRGVEVNVLIEGQPVGGLSGRSKDAAVTLAAAGVRILELRSFDSYKRYDYLHSKYLVVDGRRVTVMSENWGSGLYSNRGWGVTMDAWDLGSYYDGVFDRDFNGRIDVAPPRSGGKLMQLVDAPDGTDETVRYRCKVVPVLSPDHSMASLKGFIDSARETVLVEQMSIEPRWTSEPSLLTSLIDAAKRGTKVRVLLDSSWGRADNQAVADKLNSLAKKHGYDLEARVISPYHGLSVMHNKGLVIDDLAIVSSINWGDSALFENREVGAAVRSGPVAAFFSSLFWMDWEIDPMPPVACLPWTYMEVSEGRPVLLDAGRSSDNAPGMVFEWDIDGDGTIDSTAESWAVKLPVGNHTIVLTLRDKGNNTAVAICWIKVCPAESGMVGSAWTALIVLPAVALVLVLFWKRTISRRAQ